MVQTKDSNDLQGLRSSSFVFQAHVEPSQFWLHACHVERTHRVMPYVGLQDVLRYFPVL